jgi:hypothetical protein
LSTVLIISCWGGGGGFGGDVLAGEVEEPGGGRQMNKVHK